MLKPEFKKKGSRFQCVEWDLMESFCSMPINSFLAKARACERTQSHGYLSRRNEELNRVIKMINPENPDFTNAPASLNSRIRGESGRTGPKGRRGVSPSSQCGYVDLEVIPPRAMKI